MTMKPLDTCAPITGFGPDFPFAFDDWISHPKGLGELPPVRMGTEVAIVGAGMAGMVAAYELMKLGLQPVVYEASRMGGRLRSQAFEGGQGVVPELGGMRFPASSTAFFHYVNLLGLKTQPFPNPLTPAAGCTVIDLEGQTHWARQLSDLPPIFREVAEAWASALEAGAGFTGLQQALRERDVPRLKALWDQLVPLWDDRTFYDFVAQSPAFAALSFRHREVFGQVGFGTGGWDSDFPNSMLEILRVVLTGCDENQHLIKGGAEQVPLGLLECPEISLTGYLLGAARVQALAEPANGPLAQAVAAIAQRHGVAVVCGYPQRHPQGAQPYNAVQAIGPQGQALGHCRKTHLYGEADQQQFSPGPQAAQVFVWRGWRLGLLICFDVEFPETVRLLALQGADLVLVPTANMLAFDEVPRLLVPARACENRVFLAYAHACGTEGDTVYSGLSTVCGPQGEVLAQAGREADWLQLTLHRSALHAAQASSPLPHRRPALYGPLAAADPEH